MASETKSVLALASYIPNRESVSTPDSICFERNIGISTRLSWCQSRGPKTRPPYKSSSIVSVAWLSWHISCYAPTRFLFLLALVPVTTPRNGFRYSPNGFLLLPAPGWSVRFAIRHTEPGTATIIWGTSQTLMHCSRDGFLALISWAWSRGHSKRMHRGQSV